MGELRVVARIPGSTQLTAVPAATVASSRVPLRSRHSRLSDGVPKTRRTDLLIRTMIESPTTQEILPEVAFPMLRKLTRTATDGFNLTRKQTEVLTKLAGRGPAQPLEYRSFGFASAPAFLRYLLTFYQLGLVDRRRREKEVVYTARGDVVVALREPALKRR